MVKTTELNFPKGFRLRLAILLVSTCSVACSQGAPVMSTKNSRGDGPGQPGSQTDPGREFKPGDVKEEEAKATPPAQREAPAPGLPIREEEYKKLKEKPVRGVNPRPKHVQHDPSEPIEDEPN